MNQVLIRPLSLYNPGDSRAIVFDENGVNMGMYEWQVAYTFAEELAKKNGVEFDIETE